MIKRLLALTTLAVLLTGCYMVPMALIGPVTSGFTTASLVQSGLSTGASFVVKKTTGKSISEHVFNSINETTIQQTYLPQNEIALTSIVPKSKTSK